MGYSNLKISLLCFALLCFACNKPNPKQQRYNKVKKYFAKRQGSKMNKDVKALFVLTEVGCPTCNKETAQLIKNNLQNKRVCFLITASGGEIDLSLFNNKQHNIFYDQNVANTTYRNMFDSTKVFFIEDHQIDTTITISSNKIEAQLKYIRQNL